MKTVTVILALVVVSLLTSRISADPVQWSVSEGGNGHYYDEVLGTSTWQQARDAAELLEFNGVQGHLVTITSAEEQDFLQNQFPHDVFTVYWLGGFQDKNASDYSEPDGAWKWVTDEPFEYANWAPEEPNNMGTGSEEFLVMYSTSWKWNDYYETATAAGYYAEYVPEPSALIFAMLGAVDLTLERRRWIQ